MSTPTPNANVIQTTSPHDYLSKGISDLTVDYCRLINPVERKTIYHLFKIGGILIAADIFKNIAVSLVKENQTNINSVITSSCKYIFSHEFLQQSFTYITFIPLRALSSTGKLCKDVFQWITWPVYGKYVEERRKIENAEFIEIQRLNMDQYHASPEYNHFINHPSEIIEFQCSSQFLEQMVRLLCSSTTKSIEDISEISFVENISESVCGASSTSTSTSTSSTSDATGLKTKNTNTNTTSPSSAVSSLTTNGNLLFGKTFHQISLRYKDVIEISIPRIDFVANCENNVVFVLRGYSSSSVVTKKSDKPGDSSHQLNPPTPVPQGIDVRSKKSIDDLTMFEIFMMKDPYINYPVKPQLHPNKSSKSFNQLIEKTRMHNGDEITIIKFTYSYAEVEHHYDIPFTYFHYNPIKSQFQMGSNAGTWKDLESALDAYMNWNAQFTRFNIFSRLLTLIIDMSIVSNDNVWGSESECENDKVIAMFEILRKNPEKAHVFFVNILVYCLLILGKYAKDNMQTLKFAIHPNSFTEILFERNPVFRNHRLLTNCLKIREQIDIPLARMLCINHAGNRCNLSSAETDSCKNLFSLFTQITDTMDAYAQSGGKTKNSFDNYLVWSNVNKNLVPRDLFLSANANAIMASVSDTSKNIVHNICIQVDSLQGMKRNDIFRHFNQFVKHVNDFSKRQNTNSKINVYAIIIEETTESLKEDNPEYATYIEHKKKLIEEKKTTSEIIQLIGATVPDKELIQKTVKRTIQTAVVNNRYCSFQNLYLRKEQDKVLFEVVNSFQNEKALMEELGIPNKLGILLHGEPGCGKTTTIMTIASYIGRDVFYVNLKQVKSNEELKQIFDHVNEKHVGGGIIVFEDIDAMTSVVYRRSATAAVDITTTELSTWDFIKGETNNTNTIQQQQQQTFTLEYLLNLLDGMLTHNDSIVIMTTNHLEYLDPALYRSGRIDQVIEMKKCDHYQIRQIFKRFIQSEIDEDVLAKIPENTFTPAQIIFHLKLYVKRRNEAHHDIMKPFISE